jgi:hypothetical protein
MSKNNQISKRQTLQHKIQKQVHWPYKIHFFFPQKFTIRSKDYSRPAVDEPKWFHVPNVRVFLGVQWEVLLKLSIKFFRGYLVLSLFLVLGVLLVLQLVRTRFLLSIFV